MKVFFTYANGSNTIFDIVNRVIIINAFGRYKSKVNTLFNLYFEQPHRSATSMIGNMNIKSRLKGA